MNRKSLYKTIKNEITGASNDLLVNISSENYDILQTVTVYHNDINVLSFNYSIYDSSLDIFDVASTGNNIGGISIYTDGTKNNPKVLLNAFKLNASVAPYIPSGFKQDGTTNTAYPITTSNYDDYKLFWQFDSTRNQAYYDIKLAFEDNGIEQSEIYIKNDLSDYKTKQADGTFITSTKTYTVDASNYLKWKFGSAAEDFTPLCQFFTDTKYSIIDGTPFIDNDGQYYKALPKIHKRTFHKYDLINSDLKIETTTNIIRGTVDFNNDTTKGIIKYSSYITPTSFNTSIRDIFVTPTETSVNAHKRGTETDLVLGYDEIIIRDSGTYYNIKDSIKNSTDNITSKVLREINKYIITESQYKSLFEAK